MSRAEFSSRTKALAFQRAAGQCEGTLPDGTRCGGRLMVGRYRYDHRIPDQMGGDNSLDNCQILGMCCDNIKTPKDQRDIAKAKRIERKHNGIRRRSSFACSKDSPFRKKINGEVVRR